MGCAGNTRRIWEGKGCCRAVNSAETQLKFFPFSKQQAGSMSITGILTTTKATMRLLGHHCLNVLAPRHCLMCGTSLAEASSAAAFQSAFACQRCFDALPAAQPPSEILKIAAQHFPNDNLALSRIIARFRLTPPIEEFVEAPVNPAAERVPSLEPLIYALKYGNKPSVGEELGREVGELLRSQRLTDYDAIVPVPLHRARVRERGYNQAEEIAKGIASVLNIPVRSTYLRRSRYTQSQTLLTAKERTHNLQNVMVGGRERAEVRGATILLTDDIFTTGSTLNSCALALLECGAVRIDAATIATA